MRKATERIGYPFVHAKAGREGATQLNDNELRRIRNRLADIGPGETQVTGPDVDIDLKDPATVDFGEIQERDMRMLATALGVPVELLNHGSDGLGSGMPAELRRDLLALQNEADRRRFSDQFVDQFLRPIIREYAPFDHTQEMTLEFEPFLDDKQDMASLISQVGDYLTANEVRDKLGESPLEDEEKGESFRTPKDIESPDDQPEGGLFGSAAEQAVDREIDNRDLAEIPDKYVEGTGLSEDDFVPNESILDVIEPTLEFIDEHGLPNPDDQQEGAARINQLKDYIENNEPLAPEFWEEISNFHARHRAQGNHVCDESSLPEAATEIDNSEFDQCHFDNGWFSDRTWGGDPGKEQADRIVAAIEETEGVELSREVPARWHAGGTDFRHSVDTSAWDDWERQMFELQHGIAHGESDRTLTEITESQMPQFVKERIRDAIFSDTLFSQFDTLVENDIMQLRNFMEEQLMKDGWTTDGIADRLQDLESELTDVEAERIARTETQALVNDAREEGYRETGMIENEQFYWVGAIDDRTTNACKWLIGGSDLADDIGGAFSGTNPNYGGEPRSLEELKELVKKAAEKDPDVNTKPREYTPHINCRKTYTRDV
jgi:hypothetical protein